MFSKCAQKFIHFVFVFSSSSRACLCGPCITCWRWIWKREKTEEKHSLVLCSHPGLPPSEGKGEKFQTLKSRCGGGTMSQLFSWRRAQLDTSCDSLILMHFAVTWPWSSPASKVIHEQLEMWFISMSAFFSWTRFSLSFFFFANLFVK